MAAHRLSRATTRMAHKHGFEVLGVAMQKRVDTTVFYVSRRKDGWLAGFRTTGESRITVSTLFPTAEKAFAHLDDIMKEI